MNRETGCFARRDVRRLSLEAVFEAFHDFDFRTSRRQRNFGVARSVKVVRLKWPL